ncbi:AfsR/SARP family transcriptional regulator [Kibdelosporangium phytohabitans]|uniref:AfsR/SARP family transcriptional regulator n=1 Tax=Kibdelosporangium phytohabitans TaxID=860235 RepID=UPI000A7CFB95|nr:BTAD domain-containing putative transcriptional regulator [Kibdelosporangium phytohabitans]MBE1462630.1 DNA-binding SARP family transcriptional activator/tetratricopeptide (TPR) repeat protein [Kibdelosporangium phytohabitans]
MEFRLLGPVRAISDGKQIDLGVRKQRFVLAMMLLDANKLVPAERLVELTWPDEAPRSARGVIHTHISRLRSVLNAADAERHGVALISNGPGYMLKCDPKSIDVNKFMDLCTASRNCQDDDGRIRVLDEALALWDGPALASVAAEEVRTRLTRHLDEARLLAMEERIDAHLRLGRHAEVIHDLTELEAEHPYRQQVVAQLMLALHRSDRGPDALSAYQKLYRRLDSELGVEPAPALRELQTRILRDDPALNLNPREKLKAGPRQLPPDVDHYTGRRQHIEQICQLLTPRDGGVLPVVAITGKPGLGKTALAVRAGRRVAAEFPDGQLFIDLQGNGLRPRDPSEVLARFLRDLGVDGADVPATLEERVGLFRDRTAGRRILVVLDNAATEQQVRSLIPGNAECAVLITSRRRLTGLDMRKLVDLDVLNQVDALALLADLVGDDRLAAADPSVRRIVELCGGLPLALRIVGTKLRSRSHLTAAALAARLEDERTRLDELVGGDREIRASFLLSYDSLDAEHQRAFRLLALMPDNGLPPWATAAVLDVDFRTSERLVEDLVDVNLVEAAPGRYRFHDLIRLYAQEKLAADDERHVARTRMVNAYLHLGKRADALLEFGGLYQFDCPPFTVDAPGVLDEIDRAPAAWLDQEHPAILEAIEHAAANGHHDLTYHLSATVAAFLELRAQWADLKRVAELSLAAARGSGSPYWKAYALFAVGLAARETRDFRKAEEYFRAGLEILPHANDPLLEVVTLLSVGVAQRLQGRWNDAARYFDGCLSVLEALDKPRWRAYTLRESGVLDRYRGEWDRAEERLRAAVDTFERLGDRRWIGATLRELGIVRRAVGDLEGSLEVLIRSRDALRGAGDLRREGAALRCLAETHRAIGALDEARACAERGLDVLELTLDSHGLACTQVVLAEVLMDADELEAARKHLDKGLAALSVSGDPRWHGKALITRGRYLMASGDAAGARTAWDEARRMLSEIGAVEAEHVGEPLGR